MVKFYDKIQFLNPLFMTNPLAMTASDLENFKMLHPDGRVMCTCNKKRALWYVNRGLAKWISDTTFQLSFEPNGEGKACLPYYTQNVEARCVVCGSNTSLTKHHVVPYIFRSRLDIKYKARNHHDVLLVCIDCHEKYENHAHLLKKDLAQKTGLPYDGVVSEAFKQNIRILKACKLLEKIKTGVVKGVPAEKIKMFEMLAAQVPEKEPYVESNAWANKIVASLDSDEKVHEFIKLWRQHFIDHMQPAYLPAHWDVQHPLEICSTRKAET